MKRRVSASIDDDVLAAAEEAVRLGHAPSVSALFEEGARLQVERLRKLAYLQAGLDLLDQEFGPMTEEEGQAALRAARARSIRVGPAPHAADAA